MSYFKEKIFYIKKFGLKSLSRSIVDDRKNNDINYYCRKYYDLVENRKMLFVHVPKAAGTSFVKMLYGCEDWTHLSASDYRKIHGDQVYGSLVKIAFVRHPVSRVFSAYQYLKRSSLPFDQIWAKANIGKKTFIDFLSYLDHVQDVDNLSIEHFRKQSYFLDDDLDYIGKVETFQDDLQVLNERFSLNLENEVLNRSTLNTINISDKYLDIVYRIYKSDFDLYGY